MTLPRVLFVAPSAYTLGGLATWLDYLLPGLERLGWSVTLGLVSGPRYHDPDKYLEIHPFHRVETIHCACSTPLGRVNAVRRVLKKTAPALVLSVNIPDALKAAALERVAGRNIRAVMTCHGIQEDLFNDMRALNAEIDAVVCTNRLACRLAEDTGRIEANRIFHCAYGTAVPATLPDPPQNNVLTIGFSGRLEQPQKRIHDLIEIGRRLKQVSESFRFLIAGDGPEKAEFLRRIHEYGLTSHFELLGFVPPEELSRRLYQLSDVLIVPSSWETGPIVIWEAMAAGTLVLTSRYVGSGLEAILLHNQNCMMFDVGDVSEAVLQLLRLKKETALATRIRRAAELTVREQLSCEASSAKWDFLLRQINELPCRKLPIRPPAEVDSRLAKFLGARVASIVRRSMRRLPPDSGPGGEWPHTLTGAAVPESEFLEMAGKVDRRDARVESTT
jgi:glycosyltransferase involved in cell wall biosynthesis